MKVIEVHRSVTDSNDRDAQVLRDELIEKKTLLINLMSSPGSGKTTLLSKTVSDMKDTTRIGVIEADIDSDVDAVKMETFGAKSIQVHTDGMCHMDAGMTRRGIEELGTEDVDIAILENVGVPEGDDKPLKYPLMFSMCDALVITKMDTLSYFTFDLEKCCEHVKKLNPEVRIFPVSAKTGEGMLEFEAYLRGQYDGRIGED